MDGIPSNIIFDIFSRVPARCLARARCVSKVWCNYIDDRYLVLEPTPILYHQHLSRDTTTRSLCFHVIESIQTGSTYDYVLKPKEGPCLEFLRMKLLSKSSLARIRVRGSCNGVVCFSQDDNTVVTSLVAVHPLRKEWYELPPLPMRFDSSMRRGSCGLGFDASTNTLKMVCVLFREYERPSRDHYMKRQKLCTMVHVFGTNSWREIPQVPSYPIAGEAIFANGCLHWLVSHIDIKTEDGVRHVIWFDVEKEEFGLIDPPKRMCDLWRNSSCFYDQLVDLNGEVGYVCLRSMEVWVLKHKEWVPHCQFGKEIVPCGYIDVLGCWNKDGDILIKIKNRGCRKDKFLVYNLKSGVLHKTNIVAPRYFSPDIFMHPNKLCIPTSCFQSIGIGANRPGPGSGR